MYPSTTALNTTASTTAGLAPGAGSERRSASPSEGASAFDRLLAADAAPLPAPAGWRPATTTMADATLSAFADHEGDFGFAKAARAGEAALPSPRADQPSPQRERHEPAGRDSWRRAETPADTDPTPPSATTTANRIADARRQAASSREPASDNDADTQPTPAETAAPAATPAPPTGSGAQVSQQRQADAAQPSGDEAAVVNATAASLSTKAAVLPQAGAPAATGAIPPDGSVTARTATGTNAALDAASATATTGAVSRGFSTMEVAPSEGAMSVERASQAAVLPADALAAVSEPASRDFPLPEATTAAGIAASAATDAASATALTEAGSAARTSSEQAEPASTVEGLTASAASTGPEVVVTAAGPDSDTAFAVPPGTSADGPGLSGAVQPAAAGSPQPVPTHHENADGLDEPGIVGVGNAADAPAAGAGSSGFAGGDEAGLGGGFGGGFGSGTASPLLAASASDGARGAAGTLPRAAASEVGAHVAQAVVGGVRHLQIALEPEALGRIEVHLDFGRDGRVSALFLADTPAALDALRGEQRNLERALGHDGKTADQGSLQFSLRDRDGQPNRSFAEAAARPSGRAAGRGTDDDAPLLRAPASRAPRTTAGRLDIHA